jgi:hypothetical protein
MWVGFNIFGGCTVRVVREFVGFTVSYRTCNRTRSKTPLRSLDSWERGISDHFGRNCPTVPRVVNLVDFIPHVHNEAESIAAERFRFRWIFDGSDAMVTSGFG